MICSNVAVSILDDIVFFPDSLSPLAGLKQEKMVNNFPSFLCVSVGRKINIRKFSENPSLARLSIDMPGLIS